jgi:hypothetical protein
MFLGKKKKIQKDNPPLAEKSELPKKAENEVQSFYDRPRVCSIDLPDECVEALKSHKHDCYLGTLGPIVEVPNTRRDSAHFCLLNYVFPQNLHEYDIVIIDLQNKRTVQYDDEDHIRTHIKGHSNLSLVSSYPQTLFDPRALSANILKKRLRPLMAKDSILIVFADEQEKITYYPVVITERRPKHLDSETHWLYEFYSNMPSNQNLVGKDTIVVFNKDTDIGNLLSRHNSDATYTITFNHPTHWEGDDRIKDKNFIPLMSADPDKIISFTRVMEKSFTFFFPHIKNKPDFLVDLFERVCPGICPKLFPHSTQFSWKISSEYRLPNENDLLDEKKRLAEDYVKSLEELESRIDANRQEYGFLHDLLTESGSSLVKTIENYIGWLGLENITNLDETNPELKEEDLRVETEKGQLVIEIKGIGGTSTDGECSQVSKFKYRRSKERGSFDVFGLYLVNHQRYLPPEERTNPPFNTTQIQDAKNDERGLLTTYDLFKLYFNIANGFVLKEDAREALFQYGLVEFTPSNAIFIAKPLEIHHNGYVVIFKIEGIELTVGMTIIVKDNGYYRPAKIIEIQLDGNSVNAVDTGEIGVKLSDKVHSRVEFWLKKDS